jgi:hypothetical protein
VNLILVRMKEMSFKGICRTCPGAGAATPREILHGIARASSQQTAACPDRETMNANQRLAALARTHPFRP